MYLLLSRRQGVAALLACAIIPSVLVALPSGARAGTTPLSFSGSAVADGLEMVFHSPGFPVSDTPLDAGGPTTNATLNTYGTSQANALYPDPGSLPASAPGLVAGLLGSGAGGLPPIHLPQIPSYPFSVQSDATQNPDATAGTGPYALAAHSTPTSSAATALAGGSSGAGNVATASSSASVAVNADGSVSAVATSDSAGFAVGPLTIGEVHTTAKEVASSDGTLTPTTSAEISGVKIAGLAVDINGDGLNAGGLPVPIPISSMLQSVLSAAKITVQFQPASTTSTTASAPALIITMPADLTQAHLGTSPGSMSVILGAASATLNTGAAPIGTGFVAGIPSSTGSGAATPPASTSPQTSGAAPGGVSGPTSVLGSGEASTGDLGGGIAGPASTASISDAGSAPVVAAASGVVPVAVAGRPLNPPTFDITSLYLILVAGAAAALIISQLTRHLGVRRPWTSSAG